MAQQGPKDLEVTSPPTDSISHLSFCPKANFLVAGSWDCQLRCWEVNNYSAAPKGAVNHEAPILSTCWSGDGTKVFSGGCDNKVKCWQLASNQFVPAAQHAAPVKSVFWVEEMGCLVTGSWDKTVKFWDGRAAGAAHDIALPDRVYAMDCSFPLCVVGTAEKQILIYDLRKPVEWKKFASPLKMQTRALGCFPDKTGFAIGSIEGRVAIQHVEDKDNGKNFIFKCHRETNNNTTDVYAVNGIAFHPVGTFATCGSDGVYNFWDKDSKQRLKYTPKFNLPISSCSFNNDGNLFAYAVSYDWSKGQEYYQPSMQNQIFVHAVLDSDMKGRLSNRPRGGGRR
eukprot:TRINITY_DN2951_c0_g1_i1.p1 TRINITY_DN2951_c0_g1~~TRINITY_DN2951_c0_g1_i1.p1  ORF type:complete len:339 (+),score=75.17 TRINITY_DN2951_c0_g1_i1:124-1140(+)